MKDFSRKKDYQAPTVKVVSFKIENGYLLSGEGNTDPNRLLEIPSNNNAEPWRFNRELDDISSHF